MGLVKTKSTECFHFISLFDFPLRGKGCPFLTAAAARNVEEPGASLADLAGGAVRSGEELRERTMGCQVVEEVSRSRNFRGVAGTRAGEGAAFALAAAGPMPRSAAIEDDGCRGRVILPWMRAGKQRAVPALAIVHFALLTCRVQVRDSPRDV